MPIFRSTSCMLLHMVFSNRYTCCNPRGASMQSCALCVKFLSDSHTVHKTVHRLLRDYSKYIQCWIPYGVTYSLYSWRWAYRCPKHVDITYDNKPQLLHQVGTSRHWYVPPTPHGIKSKNTAIFKVQVLYTINRYGNTKLCFWTFFSKHTPWYWSKTYGNPSLWWPNFYQIVWVIMYYNNMHTKFK
jgi:hypothetical protein